MKLLCCVRQTLGLGFAQIASFPATWFLPGSEVRGAKTAEHKLLRRGTCVFATYHHHRINAQQGAAYDKICVLHWYQRWCTEHTMLDGQMLQESQQKQNGICNREQSVTSKVH